MRLKKIASFLRWRLVPVRYLTMLRDMRWRLLFKSPPSLTSVVADVAKTGYHIPMPVDRSVVEEIQAIYVPRTASVVRRESGHPFVNLFWAEDISSDNPVFQLAFSSKVLDVAADYFGGKLILDSIQVMYSYSTGGEIRESQYWHLDYGDLKAFHAIAYLNDVESDDDGPFVFANKPVTDKVGRSLIVRRIRDEQFAKENGGSGAQRFFGKAGAIVYVDPSACYHYGSRCKQSRLAIFVTFSTWFPFAQPVDIIRTNRAKIYAAARQVRPDLNPEFLGALLQITG